VINDSHLEASGGGPSHRALHAFVFANPTVNASTLLATGGSTANTAIDIGSLSSATVRNSWIESSQDAIVFSGSGFAGVAGSMVSGAVPAFSVLCVGAYNQAFGALSSTCM
jgi:hypothetical protein